MKPLETSNGRKPWGIVVGVVAFAVLDVVLVGIALVHGHPEVHGTPGPIATYSSPATPGPTPATTKK